MNSTSTIKYITGTPSTEDIDWNGALVINVKDIVPQERLGTGTYEMIIFQSSKDKTIKGELQ